MIIDEDEFKPLLELLSKITIYKSWTRQHSAGAGRSISFGYGNIRKQKHGSPFQANTKYPEIYNEILRLREIICPNDTYKMIVLNHNFECKLHIDGVNSTDSIAISFGNFIGGMLVIDDIENDIKYNSIQFNGSKSPHYVSKILWGDRYSLIFTNN